jgi:hypothetical protein
LVQLRAGMSQTALWFDAVVETALGEAIGLIGNSR